MLGFAVGRVGMSIDDFDRLTPPEFEMIIEQYNKGIEYAERDAWERARMISMYVLAPHVSKRLTPKSVCRFPWDDDVKQQPDDGLTPDEIRRRFEAVRMKYDG